jgi:hypothetical protein
MHGTIEERIVQRPYGWVILRIYAGIILVYVFTLLLCSGLQGELDADLHVHDFDKAERFEQGVSVVVTPGYISARTLSSENSSRHQVISDSSIPVDVVAWTEDGDIIFTFDNLRPGGSISFVPQEPCTVSFSAS